MIVLDTCLIVGGRAVELATSLDLVVEFIRVIIRGRPPGHFLIGPTVFEMLVAVISFTCPDEVHQAVVRVDVAVVIIVVSVEKSVCVVRP